MLFYINYKKLWINDLHYCTVVFNTCFVFYVDRDCCSQRMNSKFYQWENMQIRLDIWHFLRRFAAGCSSESHALYSTFMSQLSACVFKWDPEDLERCHFYLFFHLFFVFCCAMAKRDS